MSYFLNKKSIALLCCTISFVAADQARHSPVFIPQHLGKIGLGYENGKFHIEKKGKRIEVKNYDVDPMLRKMNQEQLSKFLAVGSIAVNRMNNKDYTLKAKVHGDGGGPLTAAFAAWTVRGLMYTAPVAAGAAVAVVAAPTLASSGGVIASVSNPAVANAALAATQTGIIAYMGTVEGMATGVAIICYSIPWLP